MRKVITTLFCLLCPVMMLVAQTSRADLEALIKSADKDFIDLKGSSRSQQNGMTVYACTQNSFLGESGDILVEQRSNKVIYSMRVNYSKQTEAFLKELDDYLRIRFPGPAFQVIDNSDEGSIAVSVLSGINDPLQQQQQYLSYYIDTDPETKDQTFELIIYGASARVVEDK